MYFHEYKSYPCKSPCNANICLAVKHCFPSPIMSLSFRFQEIMEAAEANLTLPLNLSCPEFTEFSSEMLTQVSFWVEGALSCSVAMAGFLGNVGSVVILSGKEMRNSFNWLLIGLACFDNVYLLGSILESFRKDFEMVSNVFRRSING